MHRLTAFSALVLLAGCGSDAPPPEPPPPPPPPSFADFAGHWLVVARFEGESNPVPAEMTSRPDGGGWMLSLAGRDSIAMRASMAGDSLILLSEPFESVLRDNVSVQARTATVLANDSLSGRIVSTYNYPDSQRVIVGTVSATRAPH